MESTYVFDVDFCLFVFKLQNDKDETNNNKIIEKFEMKKAYTVKHDEDTWCFIYIIYSLTFITETDGSANVP